MGSLPPFQKLLDRHSGDVLGFLISAVGHQEAEDCFQETFLAALRAYPEAEDRNLRSWLMTIAHRKAIDHHRAKGHAPIPVEELPEGYTPSRNGAERGLWDAVGALPPRQRTSVALRFAADMPYREIGAALDCSEEAARRNVHEGLKRLRRELT